MLHSSAVIGYSDEHSYIIIVLCLVYIILHNSVNVSDGED